MLWFCLVLEWVIIIGGLSVGYYFFTKKKKRQCQIYATIDGTNAAQISIQKITSTLQLDFVTISKDIASMSMNHYDYPLLKGAYIDVGNQCIVLAQKALDKTSKKGKSIPYSISESKEIITVTCKSCGAENTKEKGATKNCEYCGSPLK